MTSSVPTFPTLSDLEDALPDGSPAAKVALRAHLAGLHTFPLTEGGAGRSLAERLGERLSVKDFGAIGDGRRHPLSGHYATLEAARADYPFAEDLADEIDWAASQAAVNWAAQQAISRPGASPGDQRGGFNHVVLSGAWANPAAQMHFPKGHFVLNRPIRVPRISIHVIGREAIIEQIDRESALFAHEGLSTVTRYSGLMTRGGKHMISVKKPPNIDLSILEIHQCFVLETRDFAISILNHADVLTDISPKLLSIHHCVFVDCSGVLLSSADHASVRQNYFFKCNRGSTVSRRSASDIVRIPSSGGSGPRITDNVVVPHPDRGGFLLNAGASTISDKDVPHSVHVLNNRIGGEFAGLPLLRFDAGPNADDQIDLRRINATAVVITGNQCEGAIGRSPNNYHIQIRGAVRHLVLTGNKFMLWYETMIFDLEGLRAVGVFSHDLGALELQALCLQRNQAFRLLCADRAAALVVQPGEDLLLAPPLSQSEVTTVNAPIAEAEVFSVSAAGRFDTDDLALSPRGDGWYTLVFWMKADGAVIRHFGMVGDGVAEAFAPRALVRQARIDDWVQYALPFRWNGAGRAFCRFHPQALTAAANCRFSAFACYEGAR